MLKRVFIEKEFSGGYKFSIVLGFCMIFVLSLILADVPYMDDTTRMDNGLGQWEYEGRPLTTLLLALLNFNINPIYNIQGGVIMDNLDEWNAICKDRIKPLVKNGNYEIFSFNDHVSIWFKREPTFCNNYPTDVDSKYDMKQLTLESK